MATICLLLDPLEGTALFQNANQVLINAVPCIFLTLRTCFWKEFGRILSGEGNLAVWWSGAVTAIIISKHLMKKGRRGKQTGKMIEEDISAHTTKRFRSSESYTENKYTLRKRGDVKDRLRLKKHFQISVVFCIWEFSATANKDKFPKKPDRSFSPENVAFRALGGPLNSAIDFYSHFHSNKFAQSTSYYNNWFTWTAKMNEALMTELDEGERGAGG